MKIGAVRKKKLCNLLLSIGFEEERGEHHIFYYYKYEGKIVVRTKISHGGSDDITQPILGRIGKQLKLERKYFERFLAGDMTQKEYVAILRSRH
jgi:predicted RNA binding protein YcfA (HicA-like mRNA interferase family)